MSTYKASYNPANTLLPALDGTALSGIDMTNYPDGTTCVLLSQGRIFYFSSTATVTADGVSVFNATPGGRWVVASNIQTGVNAQDITNPFSPLILVNPAASLYLISCSSGLNETATVQLPPANELDSIPLGGCIPITNTSTNGVALEIEASGGGTVLATVAQGDTYFFYLKDKSSAAGQYFVVNSPIFLDALVAGDGGSILSEWNGKVLIMTGAALGHLFLPQVGTEGIAKGFLCHHQIRR
jgi:hypothetical protein